MSTQERETPAARIGLEQFFERHFLPHRLAGKPGRARFYRDAIVWLARAVDRPPTVADLTAENITRTAELIVAAGFSWHRAKSIRVCLLALLRHSERVGLTRGYRPTVRATPPPAPPRPAFLAEPPGPETLKQTFDDRVLVTFSQQHANTINGYRSAIETFDCFLGRYSRADDVRDDVLAVYREHLEAAGRSPSLFRCHKSRLTCVARNLEPERLADKRYRHALPPPPAGSLRELFEQQYNPQRLLGCSSKGSRDYRRTLRLLYTFKGKVDIGPGELCDALAAEFLFWLTERGMAAVTVNNHRGRLFALWRFASERGLVAVEPKVRKLPETLDVPDAWTEEEMRRISAAPLAIEWHGKQIGGIPVGDYLHALLLVAYWTALRRGSLFKIRREAIDLATGWMHVGGQAMKNRRGKRYRLGPDALAAIQRIWEPRREFLFPQPQIQRFDRYLRRVIAAAGVAPSSRVCMTLMHKVRRTVATIVTIKRGLAAASEMLGHSGIEITKRYVDPSKIPGQDATEFLAVLVPDKAPGPLAKARGLLAAGDAESAAWAARVALERWLRDRCQATGCRPGGGGQGLVAHARALVERDELPAAAFASIRRIAKTMHRAAHGHPVDGGRVGELLSTLEGVFAEK